MRYLYTFLDWARMVRHNSQVWTQWSWRKCAPCILEKRNETKTSTHIWVRMRNAEKLRNANDSNEAQSLDVARAKRKIARRTMCVSSLHDKNNQRRRRQNATQKSIECVFVIWCGHVNARCSDSELYTSSRFHRNARAVLSFVRPFNLFHIFTVCCCCCCSSQPNGTKSRGRHFQEPVAWLTGWMSANFERRSFERHALPTKHSYPTPKTENKNKQKKSQHRKNGKSFI